MRNLIVSLYLTLAILLGAQIATACASEAVSACCIQLENTCAVKNECCACNNIPSDKATTTLSISTSGANDLVAYVPQLRLDNLGLAFSSKSFLVENDQLKPARLYILHRSLLL